MGYVFPSHVHWCVANGRVVLLDLRADRYFALPPAVDTAVQTWLAGAGAGTDPVHLGHLLERGLLLADAAETLPLPLHTPGACKELPRTRPAGLFSLILPTYIQIGTRTDLKRRALSLILTELGDAKTQAAASAQRASQARIARAVNDYVSSRRALSAQDECLRWSIAMVRYLSRFGYWPRLVLGVRMLPFAAHAWVQDGDTVLNDSLEHIAPYTPILVI